MTTGGGRAITSLQNPLIKRLRALEADRALREREGLYLAWGLHLAHEARVARVPVAQALVGDTLHQSVEGASVLGALESAATPIVLVSSRVLDSIAPGASDQGILLIVPRPCADLPRLLATHPTLILTAHGVQDPGNLGSIIRSARGFGSNAVIVLRGSTDPFGSRAVRAAMGASFTLPIVETTASEALEALLGAGLAIVATDPAGERTPSEIDLAAPTAIVVGNEGAGLPATILKAASARVRIPMAAGVESLNVHAAAVTLLYEVARQRSFSGLR